MKLHDILMLRIHLATNAMQGILSNPGAPVDPDIISTASFEVADAMIRKAIELPDLEVPEE